MMEDDGNHAKKGKQEDYSADSSSSSSSSNNNNNDTKILKVTESILCLLFASILSVYNTVCNNVNLLSVSDLSSLFVASNNNNNDNNSNNKEAAPETSNSVLTSTSTAVVTKETHDDTQSGSDLAPFVGASLRDRIIDGMKDINDALQSRLTESENERLLVQITGVDGSPVYYEESFRNAERYDDIDDDGDIVLDFDNDGSSYYDLPLSSLGEIEIRLGGVVVQRFNIDDLNIHFDNDIYNEENPMEYIILQHIHRRHLSGLITCVDGKIGPLLWRRGQGHAGGDILLTDLLELVADENNDLTPQTLIINGLVFRVKDITGIMSLINIRDMT